ncbi:hypothetical protein E6O75_ATG07000 [Venturia nashicola]|uniref:Uncharacterized protein n=1 Tax=Venturia nashicola TaxID=86259 RepID=A0A4Z1NX23_9PEZI|nr:hypothetical protein E6O75_ATG07000 [Venturia nashicola]
MVPATHLGKLGMKSALAHIVKKPQQFPACTGVELQSASDEQANFRRATEAQRHVEDEQRQAYKGAEGKKRCAKEKNIGHLAKLGERIELNVEKTKKQRSQPDSSSKGHIEGDRLTYEKRKKCPRLIIAFVNDL